MNPFLFLLVSSFFLNSNSSPHQHNTHTMPKLPRLPSGPVKRQKGWRYCFRCQRWHDGPFTLTPRSNSKSGEELLRKWSHAFAVSFPHLLKPGELLQPNRAICRRSFAHNHRRQEPQFEPGSGDGIHNDTNPTSQRSINHSRLIEMRKIAQARQIQSLIDEIHEIEQTIPKKQNEWEISIAHLNKTLEMKANSFREQFGFDPRITKPPPTPPSTSVLDTHEGEILKLIAQTCKSNETKENKAARTYFGFPDLDQFKSFATQVRNRYSLMFTDWPHQLSIDSAIEFCLVRLRTGRSFF